MKRKLIFLNLVLLAGGAFAAWKLREQYIADQAKTDKMRRQSVKPVNAVLAAATPKPDPFTGLPYADVAQKDLFSKDRNPNVVIEVPPPPKPKVMPPLPGVSGIMGLPSGMIALMSEKPEMRPHPVHVNDQLGEFKVVGITQQTISFEWDGKRIDKPVEELLARAPAPPSNAGGTVQLNGGVPVAAAPPKPLETVIGNNTKACAQGDTSPAGTVADGYKKISEPTPFGPACRWIAVQ